MVPIAPPDGQSGLLAKAMTSWQLVIDAQGVQGPFNERGIARTITAVSAAIVAEGLPVSAVLLNPHHPLPGWSHRSLRSLPLRWATQETQAELLAGPPIVWLMLSPMEGSQPDEAIIPDFVVRGGAAVVPLVHDAIPFGDVLRYQRRHTDARMHRHRLPFLRTAVHTLAVSAYSEQDWNKTVFELATSSVIGSAPTPPTRRFPTRDDARSYVHQHRPEISRPFVLYVGGGDRRKNVDGALVAWSRLDASVRMRHHLVVAGSAAPDVRATWDTLVASLGLSDDVRIIGRTDDTLLDALNQSAELAFFPSFSEGFGMPVAEAIAVGTPAVCSNTTALPEIIGWEPGMFDPADADEMARVLTRALSNDSYLNELRAACASAADRHTWPAVARRIRTALEEHVVPGLPETPRLRGSDVIAVVAPRDQRAIDISTALAQELSVDLFLPSGTIDDQVNLPGDNPRLVIHPIGALGRHVDPARFHRRVYVLTDTPAAAEVYAMARSFPGLVVLLDESLVMPAVAQFPDELRRLLIDTYGTRLPPDLPASPTLDDVRRCDIRLLAPVLRSAHQIVASTAAVAAAAALDIGPWHRPVPTVVASTVADIAKLIAEPTA